tara:strand:+ start:262 stop:1254 length:993 start_codon:yes stop_codon:yes gene_type:complete
MSSVFTTPPPSFSNDEALTLLKDKFDISGTLERLPSDRDQVFHARGNGNNYILKIYNSAERASVIELQDAAATHIMKNDKSLLVPKSLQKPKFIKKKDVTYYLRLMPYYTGSFLNEKNLQTYDYFILGEFIGRLTRALEQFNHQGAHRSFLWDAARTDLIKGYLSYVSSKKDKDVLNYFLNDFEINVQPVLNELKRSVIHNDANDNNIILDKNNNITGIIDLGDMVFSNRCVEIATCMAYIAILENSTYESLRSLLMGYLSLIDLDRKEIHCILHIMCNRLCISVIMASWRGTLFPGNDYLKISLAPALDFLRKLRLESFSLVKKRILYG